MAPTRRAGARRARVSGDPPNRAETLIQEEVTFVRDVGVIQIPDGHALTVPEGTMGWMMQVLGGNFTLRLETGHMVRVNGADAGAIGLEVPEEARPRDIDPADFDEALVWEQLRTCYDPEIPVNIVDLGLIYGCEVGEEDADGGKVVKITMTLTAPGCGMGQILADDVEHKVASLPGVRRADVELTFEPPWSPERMSEEAQLELGFY